MAVGCSDIDALFIRQMVNISEITKDLKLVVAAIRGKWERRAVDGCTWVILGQVAFVEGDLDKFPYKNDVISWHSNGTGHWGILR